MYSKYVDTWYSRLGQYVLFALSGWLHQIGDWPGVKAPNLRHAVHLEPWDLVSSRYKIGGESRVIHPSEN